MPTPKSDAVVLFLVELRCLLCGRIVGTLETRQWPCHGAALLRLDSGPQAVPVADWSRLRCASCGGNVYAEEVQPTRLYPRVSWDPPRRGRPPRWLVALRQAARDADDE